MHVAESWISRVNGKETTFGQYYAGARAGNDSLPKLSWLPNLLWGLPTALENDFWNELSSAQKFSSLSTAATVALNGAFAWSTTTQFFQKPVGNLGYVTYAGMSRALSLCDQQHASLVAGYLSKCLWSWLVIGQPTVLVILALLLSKLQKRFIAQNKSSQYLTWRTILQVAMRLHCLANTVAFERWIAAELVVKEDWVRAVIFTSLQEHCWAISLSLFAGAAELPTEITSLLALCVSLDCGNSLPSTFPGALASGTADSQHSSAAETKSLQIAVHSKHTGGTFSHSLISLVKPVLFRHRTLCRGGPSAQALLCRHTTEITRKLGLPQERFAAMSELISRSVSTCVGLGFSPSAFLPHGQGACFAVSVFLFLSVGALPTLLFGIEEVSRTRTLLVTQLDHGTSAFGKAYKSGNKVQARQRVSFLERRLPPSRRRRGSLSARASIALLWLRAAILLLPYLAFLWAVAVRASMLAT